MSWADRAIEQLREGKDATIKPRGRSMYPLVHDGQEVLLKPVNLEELQKGDIVLVRVKGHVYLHLIMARQGNRFLIGNNRGGTNGWVGAHAIYGIKA